MGFRKRLLGRVRGATKSKTAGDTPSDEATAESSSVAQADSESTLDSTQHEGQDGLQPVWPRSTSETSHLPPSDGAVAQSEQIAGHIYPVDFVALHGLNGDLWDTWKHEDGTLWLRDLLPASLPGARVWTYGYPADVFAGMHHSTLRNNARRLLRQLVTRTREDPRPIVFICHSLGGIIAKQAFIDAADFAPSLAPRLKGIMFLGTPHRGSKSADVGTVVSNIINVSTRLASLGIAKKPLQVGILSELQVGSKTLTELHDTFVKRASLPSPLPISTFFETQDTVIADKSVGIIVDEVSGKTDLPQEDTFPAVRSHITICRFSGNKAKDNLWPDIVGCLEELAQRALQTPVVVDRNVSSGAQRPIHTCEQNIAFNIGHSHCNMCSAKRIADLRESLAFGEMHQRGEQVEHAAERAHENSFNWILRLDDLSPESPDPETTEMKGRFREWVRGDSALFWICGKAASGKSTLMQKMYHDHRLQDHLKMWAPMARIALAHMFFTAEGTQLQMSREGMLRSLLFAATAEPDMAMLVLQAYLHKVPETQGYDIKQIQWTWSDLRAAFATLLGKASSTRRFVFFIDGLDEYHCVQTTQNYPPEYHLEENSEQGRRIRAGYRDIAQLLQTFSSSKFVKICVSSRPYNEFEHAFSQCPNLRLELLTKDDIEEFVQAEMAKCADTATVAEYAEAIGDISTKALGVFLWVKIATEILVDGMVNAVDPAKLRKRLNDLPSELGGPRGLYMRILQRLDHDLLPEAWRMFDYALSARRDVRALFLSFVAEADPGAAVAMEIKAESDFQLQSRCTRLTKRLKALGGLLETEGTGIGSTVRFMHLTAKEFLLRADVQEILTANTPSPALDTNVALIAGCLLELKCLDISVGSGESAKEMRFWENIKDALYYAACAECSTGVSQTALLDSMNETVQEHWNQNCYSPDDQIFNPIAGRLRLEDREVRRQCHWADTEPQECGGKNFAWRDDFMSLAVQANLTLYIQEKLREGYKPDSKPGRQLLAYAIVPNRLTTMMQYQFGRGRDTLGANFSDASMITLLLHHGADPNAVCKPLDDEEWELRESPPTIWQLSLASGMRCREEIEERRPAAPLYRDWLQTIKTLMSNGESPDVMVRARRGDEYSPLWICLHLGMLYGYDASLTQLVVSQGGRLRPGELDSLCEELHRSPQGFDRKLAFLQSFFPSIRSSRPIEVT